MSERRGMTLDAWLEHISEQHWQTMVLGLERMHDMLDRLDLRKPPFRVATIAGTNGKGSTSVCAGTALPGFGPGGGRNPVPAHLPVQ